MQRLFFSRREIKVRANKVLNFLVPTNQHYASSNRNFSSENGIGNAIFSIDILNPRNISTTSAVLFMF